MLGLGLVLVLVLVLGLGLGLGLGRMTHRALAQRGCEWTSQQQAERGGRQARERRRAGERGEEAGEQRILAREQVAQLCKGMWM